MIKLIDTHAHLDEIEELETAISKAKQCGIKAIICMGASLDSNQKVLEISHKYTSFIFPAQGLHPWDIHHALAINIEETLKQIETNINSLVAIGEIGLDYDKRVIKLTPKDMQKTVFKRLLKIAANHDKPVSIHSRYAWKDAFDLVKSSGVKKAVFHWFTGLTSVLKDILDSGYSLSATPAAEYHEEHRRAIKETPIEQLLLETDCPVVYRNIKEHSQPSDVIRSLKAVATLKNLNEDIIAHNTTANAIRFFDLKI